MRRLVVILTLLSAGSAATSARAVAPPTPWDGTNPFNCTIQDAGLGTQVPDPGADPYCVHFDKTQQNVTQLGLVDFLLKEPARTASAVPKCFYFQEDHWRGSISQADPTPLYEFEGHYFFNKATGDGGAYIIDFRVAGQTFDPTSLPGFPPSYGGYFGPGTGGVITHNAIPADPRCAALAKSNPAAVYAQAANAPRCVPGAGHITKRGVGPASLGTREDALRKELGPPQSVKRGFLRYCVQGGGSLLVGEPGDRSGSLGTAGRAPAIALLTTSHRFVLGRSVRVGGRRGALGHATKLGRIGRISILRRGGLIAGVKHGRIVFLGAYDRRALKTRTLLVRKLRHAL